MSTGEAGGGEFVTLAEAARLAGVSERAVRKRAERGGLSTRGAVRGGRVVATVRVADLERVWPGVRNQVRYRSEPCSEPFGTGSGTVQPVRFGAGDAPATSSATPNAPPLQTLQDRAGARHGLDGVSGQPEARSCQEGPSAAAAVRTADSTDSLRVIGAELAEERRRTATLERELAEARGRLAMSERVELATQRAADKLEAKLEAARREALSLARALGQVEGDRDRIAAQLEAPRRGLLARLFAP